VRRAESIRIRRDAIPDPDRATTPPGMRVVKHAPPLSDKRCFLAAKRRDSELRGNGLGLLRQVPAGGRMPTRRQGNPL